MLSENSDRGKLTITLDKENRKWLEFIADADNRKISRQLDSLIEENRKNAEAQLVAEFEKAEVRVANGEKYMTPKELRKKLGLSNEIQSKL